MATIPFSDIVQFIFSLLAAAIWLLVRFRRRRSRRLPMPPQIPTLPDIPAVVIEEFLRERTDLRADLSPRQARETVRISLFWYESERRFEDEG